MTPRVFVIDDDPAMLASCAAVLRAEFTVDAFASPEAALLALDAIEPDAIVSDLIMPAIGGFELRRRYAARPAGRGTPFLFLSSLGDAETITAGLDAGADDFVVKPVPPSLLRARVRALVRRRRTAEPDDGAPIAPIARDSTILVNGHTLAVRTEWLPGDAPKLVTVVLDGEAPLAKLVRPAPDAAHDLRVIQASLDEQHAFAEANFRDRVSTLRGRLASAPLPSSPVPPPPAATVEAPAPAPETRRTGETGADEEARTRLGESLFDDGIDLSRRGDWEGALANWERALQYLPSFRALEVNIDVARRKLRARTL